MDNLLEANFQLMRLSILKTAKMNWEENPFSPAYIYAWSSKVYPAFHDMVQWHRPFPTQFDVQEGEVLELGKFLDERWRNKNPITFYQLEEHYDVQSGKTAWDRVKLIEACRYMYLKDMFGKEFWAEVTRSPECPVESQTIVYDYKESDVYLM